MTIDRRLHHAARELRAAPVDVPDLRGIRSPRRSVARVPAFAAPVLFVLGGLVAVTGVGAGGSNPEGSVDQDFVMRSEPAVQGGQAGGSDVSASSLTPRAGETYVPSNPPAITIEHELAMIAAVAVREPATAGAPDSETPSAAASQPGPR